MGRAATRPRSTACARCSWRPRATWRAESDRYAHSGLAPRGYLTFADLAEAPAQYILLTTFTKDGRPKPTPIWAAPDGDRLLVITRGKVVEGQADPQHPAGDAGRLRHAWRPKSEAVEATAAILDKSQTGAVYDAIGKRYGIIGQDIQPLQQAARRHEEQRRPRTESRSNPALMSTVLIPIPDRDFDPTEVAVSWQRPYRQRPSGDLCYPKWHDPVWPTTSWSPAAAWTSGLHYRCSALSRSSGWRSARQQAKAARAYRGDVGISGVSAIPSAWAQATLDDVDALLLPGGHRARGMRSYIDSGILQALVVDAFARGMVVAAICHGVLLAARSRGSGDRPLGALRTQDHGVDLGPRTDRLAH